MMQGVAATRSERINVGKVAKLKLWASAKKLILNWRLGLRSRWIRDRRRANPHDALWEFVNFIMNFMFTTP